MSASPNRKPINRNSQGIRVSEIKGRNYQKNENKMKIEKMMAGKIPVYVASYKGFIGVGSTHFKAINSLLSQLSRDGVI